MPGAIHHAAHRAVRRTHYGYCAATTAAAVRYSINDAAGSRDFFSAGGRGEGRGRDFAKTERRATISLLREDDRLGSTLLLC